MELKSYQATVLNDVSRYLDLVQEKKDIRDAYIEFWRNHDRTPLEPALGEVIEPYDNSVKGCPHVCTKVPTSGGKTFIACSSLKVIFDHYGSEKKKAVVWLVPSDAILKQTLKNLKDPFHPYRQKIDVDFSGKVEVFNKKELLNGADLSIESLNQNLNIFVMSFDSFRTKNKDARKVYEDNGSLQKLAPMLNVDSIDEEISVMRFLSELNPVVIVDESHNAKSELSIEMLKALNPSFVLDLTATPRKSSNIISFVPAIELKKANMVKLPVIVSNQEDKHSVISTAIHLQKQLESKAKSAYEAGTDFFIRQIVLFQTQPKKGEENTTYDKIKKLSAEHVRKEFLKQLKVNDIQTACTWTIPESKMLSKKGPAIQKSLYNREDDINGFEAEVINEIASMENVEWWTRNRGKKDFCINGFINHYPDFIIKQLKAMCFFWKQKEITWMPRQKLNWDGYGNLRLATISSILWCMATALLKAVTKKTNS